MKTVVAALIKKDGKYLIAKRLNGDPELIGKWEFPGGKVEPGETDEEALKREIIEEFNTLVVVGKLRAITQINDACVLKLYECEHKLGAYMLRVHSEVEWLDISQMSAFDMAPADAELVSQLDQNNRKPQLSELVVGRSYENADIARIFCVSTQGGMRKSNRANSLVLVVRHSADNPYDDRWENGEMHYTGMGLSGDQSLDYKQNKTLAESRTNGVDVHLFESYDSNDYIYRGKVKLADDPYYETQKDEFGKFRRVVKFPLKIY